jgi:hypothetical protein
MLVYASGLTHLSWRTRRSFPFRDSEVDLIVASLADPYNGLPFWVEVSRIVHPTGCIVLTAPTFEWAQSVRDSGEISTARFQTVDGVVVVPSNVVTAGQQEELSAQAGLRADVLIEIPLLPAPYDWVAPAIDGQPADLPIVLGVRARHR